MKTGQKPNISASLLVKTPQQSKIDTTTQAKLVAGSYMNVKVDEIDFFDKNPRKHRDNESYAQIKASIRASGVQHPVHITQRPNSDRYVLAQGGNTRLSIVKELWAETGDIRFASIPCIYLEYTNETDIQIAHLIENEQRQEMCFWDKAQAYSEIREIFQTSAGKEISQRQIVTVFATHGLSVSQGLLSLLFFANDKLQPLGKVAQYLSKSKTIEISKYYNDLKKRCKDNGKSEQDYEDWFVIALRDFAQYSESVTELDAERLIEYLNLSFSDYFDIQTADLFEDETELPENTLLGNLNTLQTPDTVVESGVAVSDLSVTDTPRQSEQSSAWQSDDHETGSTKGRNSDSSNTVRTPRIPKEYAYEPVVDNEQDTATAFNEEPTRQPETVSPNLSGSHNVQNTATVVYENIEEWRKEVHQKVKNVLNICYLGKCFVASDSFPLGFYIEYPDFELLKTTITEVRKGKMTIDYLHPEAGNIWLMLSIVSGQTEYIYNYYSDSNNPIMKLSDKSKLKQSLINTDFTDKLKYELIGDLEFKPFLSEKIIHLLSNTTGDKLSRAVQELFQVMQLKPYID